MQDELRHEGTLRVSLARLFELQDREHVTGIAGVASMPVLHCRFERGRASWETRIRITGRWLSLLHQTNIYFPASREGSCLAEGL